MCCIFLDIFSLLTSSDWSFDMNSWVGVPVTFMISVSWSRSEELGSRLKRVYESNTVHTYQIMTNVCVWGGGPLENMTEKYNTFQADKLENWNSVSILKKKTVYTLNVCVVSVEEGQEGKRIRSLPLKRGLPCSISAMMQPTDQISTVDETAHLHKTLFTTAADSSGFQIYNPKEFTIMGHCYAMISIILDTFPALSCKVL